MQTDRKKAWIIGLIIIIAGIVFGVSQTIRMSGFNSRAVETSALIEKIVETRNEASGTHERLSYTSYVTYQVEGEAQKRTGTVSAKSSEKAGDIITIFYDKDKPGIILRDKGQRNFVFSSYMRWRCVSYSFKQEQNKDI